MAHFAELDENNKVLRVVVVSNENLIPENEEQSGIDFLVNLFGDSKWIQTSYNRSFRKNYAGIGFTYDSTRDAFISPQPLPSMIFNEETCGWDYPIPFPNDGKNYDWDEENIAWVEVPVGE